MSAVPEWGLPDSFAIVLAEIMAVFIETCSVPGQITKKRYMQLMTWPFTQELMYGEV